jgi:hypothetical protein
LILDVTRSTLSTACAFAELKPAELKPAVLQPALDRDNRLAVARASAVVPIKKLEPGVVKMECSPASVATSAVPHLLATPAVPAAVKNLGEAALLSSDDEDMSNDAENWRVSAADLRKAAVRRQIQRAERKANRMQWK